MTDYNYMHERWGCLDRGQSAKETGRKHIPVRLYKQSARLNNQVDELRQLLSELNIMNAGKRRKEAIALLEKWYQGANSFNGQVKHLGSQNKAMMEENQELVQKLKNTTENFKERIAEKDDFIQTHMRDYQELVTRYNQNIDFLNTIPDDLYNRLIKHFNACRTEESEYDNNYEVNDD